MVKTNKVGQLPAHIAFIMDGNGRWAKKRLMPRSFGHKQGVKTVVNTVEYAFELGVKTVSLFAFSTENWQRPEEEISGLMSLLKKYFSENLKKLTNNNVKLRIMGDISGFPKEIKTVFDNALQSTAQNDGHILNIGINYGGRDEIINAVNTAIAAGEKNIDKNSFEKYLYTSGIADPDLIIRTSGEQRLSNFMLYQAAYSEFYFTKTLWPDFSKDDLNKALEVFAKRNRRFGGV